jgi:ATP-dependent DNA helicase RecQ
VQSLSPLFKEKSKWYRTAIPYNMNKEKINFLTNQRYEEFKDIEKYMESKDCLMGYLRDTLNDNYIEDCGKCANCNPLTSISSEFSYDLGVRASKFLKHHAIPIKIKKQFAKDAFPQYGFTTKISIELQHQEGRVLSKWMDAGWGKKVAKNKPR